MLTLAVKARDPKTSADALRESGIVPAVFYGAKEPSTSIAIDSRLLEKVWKEAGETTIVALEGVGEKKDALIHDVQRHPLTGNILHADFYVLEKGKKIEIAVPLEWIGQAPAEKAGHIVVKALHEIEIEVAPAELPHNLPVDLSKLENVGDHITASDIPLPPSAALITGPEEIVVSITAFEEEPEEIAPAAETVITTAKEEGEEAPAEDAPEKKESDAAEK
ncbi:MAG: 50S ribosomal protein L25 [Patescibacteria group bacterium]|nr:50S ribosomal protein L25 [Patescibacteria group bacterium]